MELKWLLALSRRGFLVSPECVLPYTDVTDQTSLINSSTPSEYQPTSHPSHLFSEIESIWGLKICHLNIQGLRGSLDKLNKQI